MEKVIDLLQSKYKDCRIIISGLLPRTDKFNEKVTPLNNAIEKMVLEKNLSFVTHNNIKAEDLKDKKHLNQRGVKIFAKNIKATYFKTTPKKGRKMRQIPKPIYDQQPKYPFQSNPLTPNPYYHMHQLPYDTRNHPLQIYSNPATRQLQPPMSFIPSPRPLIPSTKQQQQTIMKPEKIPTQLTDLIRQLYGWINC